MSIRDKETPTVTFELEELLESLIDFRDSGEIYISCDPDPDIDYMDQQGDEIDQYLEENGIYIYQENSMLH